MLFSRGLMSVTLCYTISMIPACQNQGQQSSVASSPESRSMFDRLKKKSPSEIKKLIMDLQASIIAKLTSSKIIMTKADSTPVTQQEVDQHPENLGLYYFKMAETSKTNAVALKVTPDFSEFASRNTMSFTFNAFEVDEKGAILKDDVLLPGMEINLDTTKSFDAVADSFERSMRDFSKQLTLKILKPGIKLTEVKKSHFSILETQAYAGDDYPVITVLGVFAAIVGSLIGLTCLVFAAKSEAETWLGAVTRGPHLQSVGLLIAGGMLVIAAGCIGYGLKYEFK